MLTNSCPMKLLKKTLHEKYKVEWKSYLDNSSSLEFYRNIKINLISKIIWTCIKQLMLNLGLAHTNFIKNWEYIKSMIPNCANMLTLRREERTCSKCKDKRLKPVESGSVP